jgi:hypothetical protein
MTNIHNRLKPRPHPDFQTLHPLSNLHNNTRSLMASTLSPKGGHLGKVPVVEHVVDVGPAEACCIELDKDVVGPGYWDGDGFDFLR